MGTQTAKPQYCVASAIAQNMQGLTQIADYDLNCKPTSYSLSQYKSLHYCSDIYLTENMLSCTHYYYTIPILIKNTHGNNNCSAI